AAARERSPPYPERPRPRDRNPDAVRRTGPWRDRGAFEAHGRGADQSALGSRVPRVVPRIPARVRLLRRPRSTDPRAPARAAAQALVGNDGAAAAIEVVGGPFAFRCEDRRIVAVTGRDVALRGRDVVAGWTAAFARPGETLTVVCGERSRFAYVAVSGGVTTE